MAKGALFWLLLFGVGAGFVCGVDGQEAGMVGQRFKLTGRWDGESIRIFRLQTRDARRDARRGQVEGRVVDIDAPQKSFGIGPIRVHWNDETIFVGMNVRDIQIGSGLEVAGILLEPGVLLAVSIEEERVAEDDIALLGTIQGTRPEPDGGIRALVLGVEVIIPAGTRSFAQGLTRDPDDRRPDNQLTFNLLGRPLIAGGGVGQRLLVDSDRALTRTDVDRVRLDHAVELELFWRVTNTVAVFVEGQAGYESELYREGGDTEGVGTVEGGQAWIYWANVFGSGVGIQLGRQRFRETREWWWDENLDALRLRWAGTKLAAELSIAKPVHDKRFFSGVNDPEKDGQQLVLVTTSWAWSPDHRIDLFGLWQNDTSPREAVGTRIEGDREDESDLSAVWFGVRSSGDFADDVGSGHYWIDVAGVKGVENLYDFQPAGRTRSVVSQHRQSRLMAWAADLGVTIGSHSRYSPAITLSYAFGSGDKDPDDDVNHEFRQTNLRDNNGRFEGVSRFRYYGELFRPELSNLHIVTAGLGWPLFGSSSIDFVWHRYHQFTTSNRLRDTRLRTSPSGLKGNLGDEFDLILALEEWNRLEVELVGALFRSGPAFDLNTTKFPVHIGLKFDWNF